ncbi:hypothetical protein [Streptomyces sp. NPDC089919]|uniref:SCO0607 family lipoprotein n=1 Tax=Streptomyces sp. NPDC089919 TaxID=3155188 RepID=UPI00342DA062
MLLNRPRRTSPSGTALPLLAAAGVAAALLTTGCAAGPDRICGSGDYPVKAVGNTTGQDCVPDGEEPPPGYVRYPAGKVPQHVGDKWDEYWGTVVVDQDGRIVPGPRPTTDPAATPSS